ncbi:MAG: MATE family efflux transporter, partial [Firmicutes bacterium]|nr:MATE family efflux transporter [Bacillota bacterium]
ISQGIQPIVGYNYGAQQFARVKKALYIGAGMATFVSLLGYITIGLFPHIVVRLFTDDASLIAMATTAIRTYFALLPVLGFTIIGANYFQAVGKPKQAVFLNLARQVFLLLPALLILPRYLQLMGVWMTAPVADGVASLITAGAIYLEVRFLDKKESERQLSPYPDLRFAASAKN